LPKGAEWRAKSERIEPKDVDRPGSGYCHAVRLTPRYGQPGPLTIDVVTGDPALPLIRQRRRLAETLATLEPTQWTAPSRCELWSVQDVVAHLSDTNGFWTASMAAGLKGSPTKMLATFDPVATPEALVDQRRQLSPEDVLTEYADGLGLLAEVVNSITGDEWSLLAEAPPGHIEMQAVALHALWDSWTHERDVLLPLGLKQPFEPDEVRGCLVYAAAVGPAFLAASGETRRGIIGVEATAPEASFVVNVGPTSEVRERRPDDVVAVELRGDAVELIEGLTFRVPLNVETPSEYRWLLGGLACVFDHAEGGELCTPAPRRIESPGRLRPAAPC
jgi:uncharacterized protein (TIGR03083 family)